jgi:dTDP-4-dehydrorhamnose reductase
MSRTRVLVLGASGMLGSAVAKRFLALEREFDVRASVRGQLPDFLPAELAFRVDAFSDDAPVLPDGDWAFNCIGLIKQRTDASPEDFRAVNASFPHRLAASCRERGIRLVHVTTDCVFSGRNGKYVETDPHDADDDYGRTKSAGEPKDALCLRTSVIGEELPLSRRLGLLEWVRTTPDEPLRGFINHFWNGVTTRQLAEVFLTIVRKRLFVPGVRHVFSDRISKHELVRLIVQAYGLRKTVVPVEATQPIDRTLATVHDFVSRLSIPPIAEQVMRLVNASDPARSADGSGRGRSL